MGGDPSRAHVRMRHEEIGAVVAGTHRQTAHEQYGPDVGALLHQELGRNRLVAANGEVERRTTLRAMGGRQLRYRKRWRMRV